MNGFAAAIDLLHDAVTWIAGPTGFGLVTAFLAGIFLLSGALKLKNPLLTSMAIADFGIVGRIQPALGWSLGLVEFSLGLALGVAFGFSVVVAATLLWLFVLLIARSLVTGRRFACYCFGDGHDLLSVRTLIRAILLAVLATTAAAQHNKGSRGSLDARALELVVAAALIALVVLSSRSALLLRLNRASIVVLEDLPA